MKKLAAKVLCGLFAITATAGFSMVAEAAHGDKVNIAAPFKATVLVDGLGSPWEVLWGPDNSLWVTERQAKSISKVDPKRVSIRYCTPLIMPWRRRLIKAFWASHWTHSSLKEIIMSTRLIPMK